MISNGNIYCIDANVLIQAWQKYYSPEFCPDYWTRLNELGQNGSIFLPSMVYDEITRTEDDLSDWLKNSDIPKEAITEDVAQKLKEFYAADPMHKLLADNAKGRSLADPWVIAHAMSKNAIVVTKEEKITAPSKKRIKIPNACENMGLPWMSDFEFVRELKLKFSCSWG